MRFNELKSGLGFNKVFDWIFALCASFMILSFLLVSMRIRMLPDLPSSYVWLLAGVAAAAIGARLISRGSPSIDQRDARVFWVLRTEPIFEVMFGFFALAFMGMLGLITQWVGRVPDIPTAELQLLAVFAVAAVVARAIRLTTSNPDTVLVPAPRKGRELADASDEVQEHRDIFLSYASEDRPKAATVASALEGEGWSVWWDRSIPAGKTFAEVIEEALHAAKCVVVLWSRASIESEWVKLEADRAARRRVLIPVLVEDVEIPFEFSRIQAANLVTWKGSRSDPNFVSLTDSIATLVRRPRTISPSIASEEQGV